MSQVYIDLIYNAALLIALGTIYDALSLKRYSSKNKPGYQILTGLVLSLIGIAVMARPWQIIPGVRIDARSVLLSVSGLFFGMVPTLVATGITLIYRTLLGGLGMETGYGLILTSAGIGLVWRYVNRRQLTKLNWLNLYGFGVVVHVFMLLWMFNLPSPLNLDVLRNITVPVMLFYPAVTVLVGRLLTRQTIQHESRTTLQFSEAHYRRIVETAAEGIWVTDTRGVTTFVNRKLTEITGFSEDEMLGKPMSDFVTNITAPGGKHAHKPTDAFKPSTVESTYRKKDGQVVWTRVNVTPLINDNGNIDGGLALITDISAQKQAEQELQQRNSFIETILDSLPVGVAVINQKTNCFDFINPKCLDLLGWPESATNCPSLAELKTIVPNADLRNSLSTNIRIQWQGSELILPDGNARILDGAAIPIPDQALTIITTTDVTERYKMESDLRTSEQLFKTIFEQSSAGAAQLGANGLILQANARLSEVVGFTHDELLQMTYIDLTHPDDRKETLRYIAQIRSHQNMEFIFKTRCIHKQGFPVWVELHGNVVRDADGAQLYSVVIVVDITERHLAEQERQKQQELLQSIVDNIPVMIGMTEKSGNYVLANRAFKDTMGWDFSNYQTSNELLQQIYPDEDLRQQIITDINRADRIWRDYRSRTSDGRILDTSWANATLSDGSRIGFGIDITERRNIENALIASEQLFKSLFEQSATGAVQVNAAGDFLLVNARMCQMVGYSREELLTMNFRDITVPDDLYIDQPAIDMLETGQSGTYVAEKRYFHKQGHIIWVRIHGNVVIGPDAQYHALAIVVDITAQRQAEEERRRQQELLQGIVDHLPVVVSLADADGNYIFFNRAYQDLLGWSVTETPTIDAMLEIAYPDPSKRDFILQNIHMREGVWKDYPTRTRDGRDIPMSWIDVSLPNGDHLGIGQDITERKRAEMELQEQKDLLQTIVDHLPISLNITDSVGNYVFINQTHDRTLGWSAEELGTVPQMLKLLYPDPALRQRVQESMIGCEGIWQDFIGHTRDDKDIPMSWIDIRLPNGNHLGIGQDITERKRAEMELQEQKDLLQTIVDHLPVLLNITDTAGHFKFANRAHTQILGWSTEELDTVANMLNLIYPDPELHQFVKESISSTEEKWQDFIAHTRDGRDLPMSWIDIRLPNGDHLGIGQDITERKLVEQRMRDLNIELEMRVSQRTAELESRNRELQTFTYSVSHDLKAPLRGIDGYSRLLEMQYKDNLDAEGQHFVAQVRHATELMGSLIEDLLAYSRMEQHPTVLNTVQLHSWLNVLLIELSPLIETSNAEVDIRIPEEIIINADTDGLAIAMRNLIDNALKFSADNPHPRVEIGAESDVTCQRIWVRDNGIGFDMQFHDRIFGIFQRLHRAEDYPGTGVGLAIVQRAMQRMGGRVWAESNPGQGATFYLEIPGT